MAPAFECFGVELREAGGETFSTVVQNGHLVIDPAASPIIKVDKTAVDFIPSAHNAFKKVDQRSFMLATNDLTTFIYITLPTGLADAEYARMEEVLTCLKAGTPIPARAAAAAPAGVAASGQAAPAQAQAQAAAAGGNKNELFDMLKAVGAKAAHDTQMLASAIQQKAAHDIQAFQEQQKANQAAPQAP